jgi:hypothetical protein
VSDSVGRWAAILLNALVDASGFPCPCHDPEKNHPILNSPCRAQLSTSLAGNGDDYPYAADAKPRQDCNDARRGPSTKHVRMRVAFDM